VAKRHGSWATRKTRSLGSSSRIPPPEEAGRTVPGLRFLRRKPILDRFRWATGDSRRRRRRRHALSPVASARRWSLLLLSPLLSAQPRAMRFSAGSGLTPPCSFGRMTRRLAHRRRRGPCGHHGGARGPWCSCSFLAMRRLAAGWSARPAEMPDAAPERTFAGERLSSTVSPTRGEGSS
jgi:hypothetical protein